MLFTDSPEGYFKGQCQYAGGENWLVKLLLPSWGRKNTKLRGEKMEEGGRKIFLPCSHESFLVE